MFICIYAYVLNMFLSILEYIYLSLSPHVFMYLGLYVSNYVLRIHLLMCLNTYKSIYVFMYLYDCVSNWYIYLLHMSLCIYLSIYHVYLTKYAFIYLFNYVSIYLSVHLCTYLSKSLCI